MQLQSRLLSESEVAAIHRESLRILEQAGVRFYSRKALGLLAKAGARVDDDTGIATIPAELCEQALNSSPKSLHATQGTITRCRPKSRAMHWTAPLPLRRISIQESAVTAGTWTTNWHCAFSNTWTWV